MMPGCPNSIFAGVAIARSRRLFSAGSSLWPTTLQTVEDQPEARAMLLLSISTCVAIPRRHTARPIAASKGPDSAALRWRRPPRLPRPNRPRERPGPNPLPGARNSSGTTRHFGPPRTRNAVAAKARPMGKRMLDSGRPRALRHWRARRWNGPKNLEST
jgi:hypothetical protein